MSRNEYAAVTSIQQLPTVQHRLLVEVWSLAAGVTRACNGYNFIQFAGNTYSPVGTLGGVEKVQEDSDPFPRAVRMWFAAISSSQIADMLSETLYDKPVKLYETYLTDSLTVVATPTRLFTGNINIVDYKRKDPEKGNHFLIEVESRLFRKPRAQFFNRETLWTFYAQSGDTFFDWVSRIATTKSNWGIPADLSGVRPAGPPRNRPGPVRPV